MVDYILGSPPVLVSGGVTAKWAESWHAEVIVTPLIGGGVETNITELPVTGTVVVAGSFAFDLKGTVESAVGVYGGIGEANFQGNNVVEVGTSLTGAWSIAAVLPDPTVLVTPRLMQTFPLLDVDIAASGDSPTVLATSVVTDVDIGLYGLRKSPPIVYFNGSNFLAHTASDSYLNGGTAFSCAVVFDPEAVHVGTTGTVIAKHNPTDTQAGWRVEWNATTGECTVRICTSLDGTTDLVERTTNVGTDAAGVVGIRKRTVLVFTYTSTGPALNLYVDGSSSQGTQNPTGSPGAMASNTEPFSMGCEEPSNDGANFWNGAISLVAAWDAVLSSGDVAKITSEGNLHEDVVTANLRVAWLPEDIESNETNDRFSQWFDSEQSYRLEIGLAGNTPWIIPGDVSKPFLKRNEWNVDFSDVSDSEVRVQNLNSTRVLSSDSYPSRRLYNVTHTNPNVADVDDWRTGPGDLTIVIIGFKPSGTNTVIFFECYHLELRFDRLTQTLEATIGADNAGSGNPNAILTFTTSAFAPGENRNFNLAFRYNCVDDSADLYINGALYVDPSSAGTNDYQDRTGIVFLDDCDYMAAVAVPACLSIAQIEQIFYGYQQAVHSSGIIGDDDYPERFRYVPPADAGRCRIPADYGTREWTAPDSEPTAAPIRVSTGTCSLSDVPDDGDQFRIDDGTNAAVTFEFDDNASVMETDVMRRVVIAAGDVYTTLTNLKNAINNAPALDIAATHLPLSNDVRVAATRGSYDSEGTTNNAITTPVNGSGNLSATGLEDGTAIEWNRIPHRAMLAPSVLDSFEISDFPYSDSPYVVMEPEDDSGGTPGGTIYGDPLPTIVSVVVSATGHNVTATGNAGPTDAGPVISWWEVELVDGSTEVVCQADYYDQGTFSVNRNQIDTFTIPYGQNWKDKRIRFVVQAVLDGSQVWRSLWFRMEDDGFDNGETETITIPGAETEAPPSVEDLTVTITESLFLLREEEAAARVTIRVAEDSRYKLTAVFRDADRDDGPEFDVMSVLDDFYSVGEDFQIHRVRERDLGFLDRLAVEFYGPGNESLWWVIAYANAIEDPEIMEVGSALVIPSRDRVRQFVARRPS